MTEQAAQKQSEIDANYQAFTRLLPALMKTHAGKFAVMRRSKIIAFFDTNRDAMIYGAKTWPDALFSVQEVTQNAVDLGWFAHADLYHSV